MAINVRHRHQQFVSKNFPIGDPKKRLFIAIVIEPCDATERRRKVAEKLMPS
jgi:hypothetical protein